MSPLLLSRMSLCRVTPSLLPQDIANGWEAGITEFGWLPDGFAPGACPNRPGGSANRDDTAPSCDGAQPAISLFESAPTCFGKV